MNFLSKAASILLLAALSTAVEANNVNSQSNSVDITPPPRRHATKLSSVKCLNERDTIAVRNSEGGFDRITCAQLRAMGK
jgi:hypothetical protein